MSEAYLAQQPIQIWNPVRGVWEKPMASLLCEHWELFSEAWQTLGMMRNGQVFALPMPAHLTADSEYSSQPQGLPTPTTRDYKDGTAGHERDGVVQTDTVARAIFNSGEVTEVSWGKFEPAIRRWEVVMNRPTPAPTLPDGKEGAHRLSPWFTEWMMGLPEGWICDPEIGLTRNEQLKACGNGVVPQQAELALRILLEGIDLSLGGEQVNLPTPTVSNTFTSNLKSTQQKEGSMHSVTLPQAVERLVLP
jgi:hypothetical protein